MFSHDKNSCHCTVGISRGGNYCRTSHPSFCFWFLRKESYHTPRYCLTNFSLLQKKYFGKRSGKFWPGIMVSTCLAYLPQTAYIPLKMYADKIFYQWFNYNNETTIKYSTKKLSCKNNLKLCGTLWPKFHWSSIKIMCLKSLSKYKCKPVA